MNWKRSGHIGSFIPLAHYFHWIEKFIYNLQKDEQENLNIWAEKSAYCTIVHTFNFNWIKKFIYNIKKTQEQDNLTFWKFQVWNWKFLDFTCSLQKNQN